MLFYFIAAVFAILGGIFFVADLISEELEAKRFACLLLIASAATMLIKLYLENQEEVNSFIKASLAH